VVCSSLGCVYGEMYVGKENPSHAYVALHVNVNIIAHIKVCKLIF
jgi:hypothetical protein